MRSTPAISQAGSKSTSDADRLTELLADCHDDPDLFNSGILGREPFWSGQRRIADSIARYRITVAYTGNAVGKDYLVGSVIPWWMLTRHKSLVIVTGPSQTVLGSVTWKEVRAAIEGSKFPLSAKFSEGVKSSPQTVTLAPGWQALGFSTTSVERASGQHNRKLLCIVEEASGVEDVIYDAIDSLKFVRLLLIGNPIRATGRFVELIRQADKDRQDGIPAHRAVNAIRIQSTESPDAHLDESPRGLADATWLADVARRYGTDSLWFRSHVRAEIPSIGSDQLLPEAWLDWAASISPRIIPANHPVHGSRRISVDLGEGVGRDSSAVIVRDDWGILEVKHGAALGLGEAAEAVARLANKFNVPDERITYDRVGIGREFPLHLARRGITRAVGYAGEASPQSSDFTNLRTEAAWKLRDRLNPDHGGDFTNPHATRPFFSIPPGPYWHRMREELRTLSYSLAGRQTKLLKKDDWAKILGHSPDLADALIQSFAF